MQPATATKRELFFQAGQRPNAGGVEGVSGVNLANAAIGHPQVLYKLGADVVLLEADVHMNEDATLTVQLICPQCQNSLWIHGANKTIHYDPTGPTTLHRQMGMSLAEFEAMLAEEAVPGPVGQGGTLSIEAFACTWETEPTLRRSFGLGICGWSVAIDANVARRI